MRKDLLLCTSSISTFSSKSKLSLNTKNKRLDFFIHIVYQNEKRLLTYVCLLANNEINKGPVEVVGGGGDFQCHTLVIYGVYSSSNSLFDVVPIGLL